MACNVVIITKIGKNYGALLQAFALKKAVEKMGPTVKIVNYALPQTMNTYKILPKVTGFSTFQSFVKALKNYSVTRRSVKLFLEFREEFFDFTDVYQDYQELKNSPPEADVYITGSDQVWNPSINFDPAYYLMFGKDSAVRASYAASIGISSLPEKCKDEFKKRVLNITYRSVREDAAKKILDELGISSCVTLDPTLLHDKSVYDEIVVEPQITKPYILMYLLIMPENVIEYVDEIKRKYPDCMVINIPGSSTAKKIGDLQIAGIGPKEFLGLVKNAKAVLTSSFHGTVFSIVYEKNFMSILPNDTGVRIKDLLNKLNLSERIANSPQGLSRIETQIDYLCVNNKLDAMKKQSYDYLNEILKESCK